MGMMHNNMLTGAGFHELLSKYSICPPSNIGGYLGTSLTKPDPKDPTKRVPRTVAVNSDDAADDILKGSARSEDVSLKKVDKAHKIAYIDLTKEPLQKISAATRQREEGSLALYLNPSATPTPNHIPVWFLPWLDGSSIRLTIPPMGSSRIDPNVFFTAAINGCSIFFQGDRKNPTIYHNGGYTGYAKAQTDQAAEFWESVFREFVIEDAELGKKKGVPAFHSVNKKDYVADSNYTSTVNGQTVYSTSQGTQFERSIRLAHQKGSLRIEEVRPWGSVLGQRDISGNWTFYLQENATIVYHQISSNPIKRAMGNHKTLMVSRPMSYREIFPNGPSHATVNQPLPKII